MKEFYGSKAFKDKAAEAAPFLNDLKPFLYGRPNDFENMVSPLSVSSDIGTNHNHICAVERK